MKSTYEDIRRAFSNRPYTLKCLEEFIQAKETYLRTNDIQDRIILKTKYVDIYEEIKTAYYGRRYSEEIFLSFKECLQDMGES